MSGPIPQIKDLEGLISKYIDPDQIIMNTSISRLTAYGENFGSEIFKIDLDLKSKNDSKKEKLYVVAKIIPELTVFREVFNIEVTFRAEKGFYETIVPLLNEFQKEQGIKEDLDIFPKFYGARINLRSDGEGKVDDDAVLVLENLKTKGFINVDRLKGFDLPTTEIILKKISTFHALNVAFKCKHPNIFNDKIKPLMVSFNPPPPRIKCDKAIKQIIGFLESSNKFQKLIPKMQKSLELFGTIRTDFKEPFATFVHKDLWVNNLMIKFENSKAVACKIVDFQMYCYDSPAADLFFFLFTSVQTEVLQEHLDDLLRIYQETFSSVLKGLGSEFKFTMKELNEEMRDCALWQLGQTFFMYVFIINQKKIETGSAQENIPYLRTIDFDPEKTKRLFWILEQCDRRGWLDF